MPLSFHSDSTGSILSRQQGIGMYLNQFLNFLYHTSKLLAVVCMVGCRTQHIPSQNDTIRHSSEPRQVEQGISVSSPDWARGMVWYQIFPERFSNGNTGNDPRQRHSTTVSWDQPFDQVTIEEIERGWMLAQAEPELYGYQADRAGGAIANVIYQRRYGGDLQGVLDHLDSLKELGVDGVYICPIFTSTSLHKYDAGDHRHIDPTLAHPGDISTNGIVSSSIHWDPSDESTWAMTPADTWFVETFIHAVHERGMKLTLDGVWNHVGLDHWAFDDVRQNGASSRFVDWFDLDFDDDGRLIGWDAWDGKNGRLPVFRQTESGDLAPGPKSHIMAVTRRWMDPNGDGDPSDGIDGWRLDVANEVGRVFWKDWRGLVKTLNPDAYIVGEIWFDARAYFDGTAFDAQMNYPMAYAVADWLSIGHMKGDANSLASRLTEVYSHELSTDLIQLNLMSSHDTERLGSLMHNDHQRGFDQGAHPWRDAQTYDRDVVSDDALVRALVSYMVMVANPGSVMIYNGDEFAMVGADDPDDRRPIPSVYFEPGGLDLRTRWFRDEVAWIMALLQDQRFGVLLRDGEAKWGASDDGRGLRITRLLEGQSLEIAIGPCGVDWGEPEHDWVTHQVSHSFEYGSSCWGIVLRLMDTTE